VLFAQWKVGSFGRFLAYGAMKISNVYAGVINL